MRNFVVLNVLLYFTATHCFELLSVLFFVRVPWNTFKWLSVFGHASINFCFLLKYINLVETGDGEQEIFYWGKSQISVPPTYLGVILFKIFYTKKNKLIIIEIFHILLTLDHYHLFTRQHDLFEIIIPESSVEQVK